MPRTPQGGCGSSKLAHENVLEGQVGGILLTFQPYGALKDVIPCDEPSKLIYRAGTLGWRLEQRTGSQPEDELGVFEETELNHVWTGENTYLETQQDNLEVTPDLLSRSTLCAILYD